MSYHSWKDIYKTKSSIDLYRICKGYGYPTYPQKKLALEVLKERSFDFESAEDLLTEYSRNRKLKKEKIRETYPIAMFLYQNIGWIVALLCLILFSILQYEIYLMPSDALNGELAGAFMFLRMGLIGGIMMGVLIQILRRFLPKRR